MLVHVIFIISILRLKTEKLLCFLECNPLVFGVDRDALPHLILFSDSSNDNSGSCMNDDCSNEAWETYTDASMNISTGNHVSIKQIQKVNS